MSRPKSTLAEKAMSILDVVFASALFMFSIIIMSEVDVPITGTNRYIPWTDALLLGSCAAWFITRGVYRFLRL